MKTKFARNLIEMIQNIQSVEKKNKNIFAWSRKQILTILRGGGGLLPLLIYSLCFFVLINWSINFQLRPNLGLSRYLGKVSRIWNPFSVEMDKVTTPPFEGSNSAFKLFKDRRP